MKQAIKTKIILGFVLIAVLMALTTMGLHSRSYKYEKEVGAKIDNYHAAFSTSILLMNEMLEETNLLEDFQNDKNPLTGHFEQSQASAKSYLASLRKLINGDTKIVKILDNDLEPLLIELNNAYSQLQTGNKNLTSLDLNNWINNFSKIQVSLLNELNNRIQVSMESYDNITYRSYQTNLLLIILLALLAILLGYVIARSITLPLGILMQGIRKINAGSYEKIQNIRTNDEVGELVSSFNQMVGQIRENEMELKEQNEELQAQGEELMAQNEEMLAQQDELNNTLSMLEKREQALERLYHFTQSLVKTIDVDELINNVLKSLMEELNAQTGSFWLYNPEKNELQTNSSAGLILRQQQPNLRLGEGLAGQAAKERKMLFAAYNAGQLHSQGIFGEITMASEAYIPLIFQEELLGVIGLGFTSSKDDLNQGQKRLLTAMADQITIALNNAAAHQKTNQALEQIKELDNLKSELINTVSHELRTPLASILGFAELLLQRNPGGERAEKYLETIYEQSVRLTDLVNNFLDLQRIESGRLEFNREPLDLTRLVTKCVDLYRGQSSNHDLQITMENNLPEVWADPDRLTQVLGNLLSNAIKYSPEGGVIEISCTKYSALKVAIAVRDYGLGIPEEAQQKLFQPFYRVDNSDRRQIGGTGLGLVICQRIVRELGGEIWVESVHGKGSTFAFTLPTSGALTTKSEEAVERNFSAAARGTVVVIEDDKSLASLLTEALQAAGYHTKAIDNGPAALEFAQNNSIKAIILDLILIGSLDGWEVLKLLKQNKETSGIPVIISSSIDNKKQWMEKGAADYLVKPFSPKELVESVRTVVGLAEGDIGIPHNDYSNGIKDVGELLKSKGLKIKDIKKEKNLLVAILHSLN